MSLIYICVCFSSAVYLHFRILMYVKRHEQFEIGCGAILNKNNNYYYYYKCRQWYHHRCCEFPYNINTPWFCGSCQSKRPSESP